MRSWTHGMRRIVDCPPLGRMIAGYKVDSPGVPDGRTWDPYVLVFTTAGHGWFRDVEGRASDLEPGDALLLFPGLGHAFAPRQGQRWSEFFIIFSGPAFEPWYRERLLVPAAPVVRLQPVDWWLRRFQEAVGDPDEPVTGFAPLYRFQALLAEVHQALVRKPGSEAGGWLEQVKGALERSALGRPDLAAVAKGVGTSEQVLRKRFRALTGQSPHQWYGGIQMRRACDLLKEGTVKDVADRLGYCDQFQFSRRFKQLMGIPPVEFQRRFR
jgi:AraC-like DNA-binding protein